MSCRRTISRRSLLRAASTVTALFATPAWAQRAAVWPDRPVRLIVPYPAGGSTDVLFRLLAERLQDKLNQPFVVENRAGASGNVGIDAVAKSAPDGYMIGGATVGHFSINQFLIAKMPYDAEKDLVTQKRSASSSNGLRRDQTGSRLVVRGQAPRHISPEFCSRHVPALMPYTCHSEARRRRSRRCWPAM